MYDTILSFPQMDNEMSISANLCAVSEGNLGAVLFADYDQDNLIVAPDGTSGLAPRKLHSNDFKLLFHST